MHTTPDNLPALRLASPANANPRSVLGPRFPRPAPAINPRHLNKTARAQLLQEIFDAYEVEGEEDDLFQVLGEQMELMRLQGEERKKRAGQPSAFDSLPSVIEAYAMVERDGRMAGSPDHA